jgi:hypothetical protein
VHADRLRGPRLREPALRAQQRACCTALADLRQEPHAAGWYESRSAGTFGRFPCAGWPPGLALVAGAWRLKHVAHRHAKPVRDACEGPHPSVAVRLDAPQIASVDACALG